MSGRAPQPAGGQGFPEILREYSPLNLAFNPFLDGCFISKTNRVAYINFQNIVDVINPEIKSIVQAELLTAADVKLQPVGGGSINRTYHASAGEKSVFVKLNNAEAYPGMFEAEARGLELLSKHSQFEIPRVLKTDAENNTAYLVMEWITNGGQNPDFWENFAQNLADMHRHSADQFGLDYPNYIGSLHQQNDFRKRWPEFYIEMRLEPQLRMARDRGHADAALIRSFEKLFSRMENLFPAEPPALLHGDLWSGNFMCTASGQATIFDPAIYYGHREMDMAMSKLFGGFDRSFYEFYHESYPLENGWQERIPLGQLYPLLVHVNLFGSGYLSQVKSCLRGFV